jgi:hypothetical protein
LSVPEREVGKAFDVRIAIACFAAATVIGLVAAFVGLDRSSLWYDELYTAWVVAPAADTTGLLSRALKDVTPPGYYLALWPMVRMLGNAEIGLRLPSAVSAVAAVLLLVGGSGRNFSMAGRLFAGAMATGSFFWFFQAQNARCYALAFLLGTAVLLFGLAIVSRRSVRPRTLAALLALTFASAFVHFYLMYECVAVLLLLALLVPRHRPAFLVLAALLLVSALAYVKLVISHFTQHSLDKNWIANGVDWYSINLRDALNLSFDHKALLALAVCLAGIGMHLVRRHDRSRRCDEPAHGAALRAVTISGRRIEIAGDTIFLVGVPVIVLAAGITSSMAFAPNFTSRNLLICSPFLWALLARAYDFGVAALPSPLRTAANLSLSVIVVWMASTMAVGRFHPRGEAFRESAQWIASQPACRDEIIPVLTGERKEWFRSATGSGFREEIYGKYLGGFARPESLYVEDVVAGRLRPGLAKLLRDRIDGIGCPVLAWTAHFTTRAGAEALGRELLEAVGRTDRAADLRLEIVKDGQEAYVLYVQSPARR